MKPPNQARESKSSTEIEFTKLLLENERAIYGFIYSLTHDRGASEELRQELAERLWQKFDEFDRGRPFIAWSIGFARLLVFEWRRRQSKLPIPLEDEALNKLADAAAARVGKGEEIHEALQECAKNLTDLQRKTLHQRYYEETSVAQMAKALGRTQMAVYKVLKRVHQSLAGCLREKLNLASKA